MSYIPLSKEYLRSLKTKQDEEIKERKIQGFVQEFYQRSVNFAKTKTDTIFMYNITNHNIIDDMDEILRRLRILFPDSLVEYKKVTMARGRDGKDYDLSIIDDKVRQFIDIRGSTTTENIVIDYSN